MPEALGSIPAKGDILLLDGFLFSHYSVESTECISIQENLKYCWYWHSN